MAAATTQDQARFGFFAWAEDDEKGFVGGLLVANRFGRPIEFQCTAPVKPNRTQQILYGPTLRSYVLVELLAKTLVDKIGVKPQCIFVDDAVLLELQDHTGISVGQVLSEKESSPHKVGSRFVSYLDENANESFDQITSLIPATADIGEPFDRVREALKETMRLGTSRAA